MTDSNKLGYALFAVAQTTELLDEKGLETLRETLVNNCGLVDKYTVAHPLLAYVDSSNPASVHKNLLPYLEMEDSEDCHVIIGIKTDEISNLRCAIEYFNGQLNIEDCLYREYSWNKNNFPNQMEELKLEPKPKGTDLLDPYYIDPFEYGLVSYDDIMSYLDEKDSH